MTRRSGSILVLALWTLMVLGFLAFAVGAHVAAGIRTAQVLRERGAADALARAGVELAVAEIMLNATNYMGTTLDDLESHDALFLDNRTLPGGRFSVWYTFDDTNLSSIITNYGVLSERAKIDIDRASETDFQRLSAVVDLLGGDRDVASQILSNYPSQKTIAPEHLNRYGPYEALPELLMVEGMDQALFQGLEPLVTLRQFQRRYPPGVDSYERREAFGGLAEGRAEAPTPDGGLAVTAVRRIAFVFDRVTTNFLYWREH